MAGLWACSRSGIPERADLLSHHRGLLSVVPRATWCWCFAVQRVGVSGARNRRSAHAAAGVLLGIPLTQRARCSLGWPGCPVGAARCATWRSSGLFGAGFEVEASECLVKGCRRRLCPPAEPGVPRRPSAEPRSAPRTTATPDRQPTVLVCALSVPVISMFTVRASGHALSHEAANRRPAVPVPPAPHRSRRAVTGHATHPGHMASPVPVVAQPHIWR